VFTPTLLTILGVIMYVRLGWVVGNAGLGGAWLIMAIAMGITACTGLSLASIATNTRLGAGGPYAIISKSLGLEVGGSIGVPLYLTRPLGVAMYVFGFREGWQWIFPEHPALLVDMVVFAALFGISYWSADLAFRVQYVIMAVIVVSLAAIVGSPLTLEPAVEITWFGAYPGFPEQGFQGADFWVVFAVFFPATTGIMAGANMSGELKNPRRSIPVGALSAIAISSVIYMAMAWWVARAGTMTDLATNYNLIIDRSLFPPAVLAGLLGATFSSALASMVGGPRILMAMGQHGILPRSDWLAGTTTRGEPRNAMLVTGGLTLLCLMVRDLNAIAPLITMFFLITYGVVNVVVLIEGNLGLVSFRPTLRIHWSVPFVGLLGCIFSMFIVAPIFGLVAVITVVLLYLWIQARRVASAEGDMRSSIFVAMAEWAAARVTQLQGSSARAWKPNMLIPVEDPARIRGEFHFLLDVCRPEGSVKLLGIAPDRDTLAELAPRVGRLGRSFQGKDVFATWSMVRSADFCAGVATGLQALQSAFFRPNILFLTVPEVADRHESFHDLILHARETGVGVLLLGMHQAAHLGQCSSVNLWIRPAGLDWDIDAAFQIGSMNLTVLMGYRLKRTWGATIHLVTVVPDEDTARLARRYLHQVCDRARLPSDTHLEVLIGPFKGCIPQAPESDLNIMGLQPDPDFHFASEMVSLTTSTCLFVLDSGRESALA